MTAPDSFTFRKATNNKARKLSFLKGESVRAAPFGFCAPPMRDRLGVAAPDDEEQGGSRDCRAWTMEEKWATGDGRRATGDLPPPLRGGVGVAARGR